MHHPKNRAERRHERERVINRRRFVYEKVWFTRQVHTDPTVMYGCRPEDVFTTWGKYAKFNLGCGCTLCHGAKYFKCLRKRREALAHAESQAEFRKLDKVAAKY